MDKFITSILASLNKFADFKGVAKRQEFWFFALFNWLVSFVTLFIDRYLPGNPAQNITSILLLLPSISVAIRRMHDTNHRGWWMFFPFYNIVLSVSPSRESRWSNAQPFGWSNPQ